MNVRQLRERLSTCPHWLTPQEFGDIEVLLLWGDNDFTEIDESGVDILEAGNDSALVFTILSSDYNNDDVPNLDSLYQCTDENEEQCTAQDELAFIGYQRMINDLN